MKYFYLKVNQNQPFTYRNLQNWINVVAGIENAKIVVINDKPDVAENIMNICKLIPGMEFIASERDEKVLQELCAKITDDRWRNAGYAHLTAFWHASQQEDCDAFWNIDADDTYLCLSEARTREALLEVEEKAKREGILAYSLDMHASRGKGEPWSFGITYTDNRIDWIGLMRKEAASDLWAKAREIEKDILLLLNIDMFFTYIMKKQYAEEKKRLIGSFYFDHAWFLHYSIDFLGLPFLSGLYQWRNGRIYTPIFSDLLKAGKYPEGQLIPGNVDRIDLSITEDESLWGLQKYVFFGPFEEGNRSFVDALPYHEAERWSVLNDLVGYDDPKIKRKEDVKPDAWQEMMSSLRDLYTDGNDIYDMLKKSRPADSEIIVCPGHMGDTLLIAALAKAYKEQHGSPKLIFVSASLPEEVLNCFSSVDAVLMLEKGEMESLRFYIMIRKLWNQNGIRYAHFQDEVVLNYPCVSTRNVIDYREYSLRENRMNMMDLKMDSAFAPLNVPSPDDQKKLAEKYGHAVLLMPVSYSTDPIPDKFWEKLAASIRVKGFDVYTNYNGAEKESVIPGTIAFQSSFYEMAQMAEFFSLFVGIRSGLCDLISLTGKGRLVILYQESVCGISDDFVVTEDNMKESNIYDLGRNEGIACFRYSSRGEERVINEICKLLDGKREEKNYD